MSVSDTGWQTKRRVDKKHTARVHAGKMKGIEAWGADKKERDRQRDGGGRKGKGCYCHPTEGQVPKSKNIELSPNNNSL